jgi:hypothetical protein
VQSAKLRGECDRIIHGKEKPVFAVDHQFRNSGNVGSDDDSRGGKSLD